MMATPMEAETLRVRHDPAPAAVTLLHVSANPGAEVTAAGTEWHTALNVLPGPSADGPDPVEALLASLAACFVRCLRWVAEGAHVSVDRCELDLAAARDELPPAVRLIRMEVTLDSRASDERVVSVVRRALRAGTVTRTIARASELSVVLRLNGVLHPIAPGTLHLR
jgi:uncharacterized OsmC-like protein